MECESHEAEIDSLIKSDCTLAGVPQELHRHQRPNASFPRVPSSGMDANSI